MTASKTALIALSLAAALFLPAGARAAVLPDFGPTVQFDPAGPQPTVSKLKGKAVIVLFFQSSDKAGGAWTEQLIQEMQESFATNRSVVLLAMKTDGGGIPAAKGFLSSKGANTDQWLVACDNNAKYSSDIVGDPTWYYLIVGADSTIIERGKAGVTYHVQIGADKKKRENHYALAKPSIIKPCGKIGTVLPAGKSYAASVAPLVRLAELGDAEKAMLQCAALLNKPKEKQAASELLADLQPIVEKRVSDRVALLGDAAKPSPDRYDAYNDLALMLKDLKTHPLAAKINPALAKARQEPALQKEARADSAYKAIMARVQKATPRDMARLAKELEALAKQFEGTKYGQAAADSASTVASSAETPSK
jgi:hypothetical protein